MMSKDRRDDDEPHRRSMTEPSAPSVDTEPIRTLLVDDEPGARRGLRLLLSGHDDFRVVGECGSVDEVVEAIGSLHPHVVFLDVRMPGGTGIDALRKAPRGAFPLVVLVTAFEEHALEAFDVEALDYLLKPFSDEAFERSVTRVRRHVDRIRVREATRRIADAIDHVAGEGATGAAVRIGVRYADRVHLLEPESIRWVAAEGDYVRLHTADGEHLLRETMRGLEERLADAHFIRIHRSTLVRADYVREVRSRGRGRHAAVLRDGTQRDISRSGQERLEEALGVEL